MERERPETIKVNRESALIRYNKANEFYEDESIPKEKKEKFYPAFEDLLVDVEAYRIAYNEVMLNENQTKMI